MDRCRWRAVGLGWIGVLCLASLLASAPAQADIFPDLPPDPAGTKRVPVSVTLDWGPFAEVVSRRHEVVAGDTLRAIATRYYGDAKAWKPIVAANPTVVQAPDVIRAGSTLWIPPLPVSHAELDPSQPKPPVTGAFEAVWAGYHHAPGWQILARASAGELADRFKVGGTLVLVPAAVARPAFQARERGEAVDWSELPTGSLRALLNAPDGLVPSDSRVAAVVAHYRLDHVEGDLIEADVRLAYLDAAGAPLPAPAAPAAPSTPGVQVKPAPADAVPGLVPLAADLPAPEERTPKPAGRWPTWVGGLVALLGLLVVLGVVFLRRQATRDADDATS